MLSPLQQAQQLMSKSSSFMKIDYKKLFYAERRKNEYLNAVVRTYQSSHNVGEKDEVLAILKILYLQKSQKFNQLVDIFGDDAEHGVQVINKETNTVIEGYHEVKKAKGTSKSDATIKMIKTQRSYNMSIKSKTGANPAILNHTPRSAKIFQESEALHKYLPDLDKISHEYNELRSQKIIGEDVNISKLKNMNDMNVSNHIKKVISYFMFEGSGKGDSSQKADSILLYDNNNIEFIDCSSEYNKTMYIDKIMDKCIISFRDKGMPKNITESCKPWIFLDQKENGTVKHKGSLHIRIK